MISRKNIFALLILIPLLLVGIFYIGKISPTSAATLELPHKTISLMIADTEVLQEQGLSGRTFLPENSAMIFIFNTPDRYAFWMKDMKFPIDIIWLDENFAIVDVKRNATPETFPKEFTPQKKSLYVIEANTGFFDHNELHIGDIVKINLNK